MASKKPKLLARIKFDKNAHRTTIIRNGNDKEKTEKDILYDIIDEESCKGYRFCDNYITLPWITKDDIEEKGNGIYVIKFRCPIGYEKYGMPQMIRDVCIRFNSEEKFIYEEREEYGIKFIEAAWVLQKGKNYETEYGRGKIQDGEEVDDEHKEVSEKQEEIRGGGFSWNENDCEYEHGNGSDGLSNFEMNNIIETIENEFV